MWKKWLIILGTLPILVIIAGVYKFNYLASQPGYTVDGNKIISGPNVVCDENKRRFANGGEARKTGLSESEYGATYCPEYKMDPSWDKNKDGINDCYEGNSCNSSDDYMLPRTQQNTKEKEYYQKLREKCEEKNSKSCCLASLEHMKKIGAKLAENDKCQNGYSRQLMRCIDTFVWCEKEKNDRNEVDRKMIIKIPTWEFDKEKDDFLITFKEYEIREDPAILRETLKKLFEVKGGDSREAWNGLRFDSVSIKDGVAIVKLSGNWYPVGDMSGAYFSNEIEAAVFQFNNIKNLRVLVNEEIFDWCIDSEAEPEESGCDKNKILWDTSLKK